VFVNNKNYNIQIQYKLGWTVDGEGLI